jgi:hypothetical protein
MADITYGLTPEGFTTKRQPTISDEIFADLSAAFGNIDQSPQSVFGQLNGVFSTREAALWELLHDLYLNNSLQAEGVSLDNVVSLIGLQRLAATKSLVTCAIYADYNTVIPVGFAVTDPETNNQFVMSSTTPVTVNYDSVLDSQISIDEVHIGSTYTININGTGYNYVAITADTIITIATALCASINAGQSLMYASDNLDGTFRLTSVDFENGFAVTVSAYVSFSLLGISVVFACTELGPILVPALSVSVPVTSVSGVSAVLNLKEGTPGRNVETDDELRSRHQTNKTVQASSTIDAMRSRILQEVAYVKSVSSYENVDSDVDAWGRPPHSIELVVDCPTIFDQTVANKIWQLKPAGISTYGNANNSLGYNVQDTQGFLHRIYFSKPITKYTHILLSITRSTEERFPFNGAYLVGVAINTYGQTMIMGQDLINQKFMLPIYSVSGIASVALQFAVTNDLTTSPVYQAVGTDITIQPTQICKFDLSRIHVSVI